MSGNGHLVEPREGGGAVRVARNVGLMSVAQIVARGLTFAFNIFLARHLGVTGLGQYSFAFALVAFVGTLGDWGFGMLATRDIAEDRRRTASYVSNLSAMCLALGLLVLGLTAVLNAAAHRPPTVQVATALVAVYWTAASVTNVLSGVLRALERLDIEAAFGVGEKLVAVGVGLYAIWRGWGLVPLVLATTVAGLLRVVAQTLLTHWRLVPLSRRLDATQWVSLARRSIPLGLAGTIIQAYYRTDMMLLPLLKGDRALGVYAVPRKVLDVLMFLPGTFMNATLPRLVAHAGTDPEAFRGSAVRAVRAIGLLTVPVAGLVCALSPAVVPLLFGREFASSAVSLQIGIWTHVVLGTNCALWAILTAADRQVQAVRATAAALAANLVLNLLLIRPFSYNGAATSLLCTELISCALLTRAAREVCGSLPVIASWCRPLPAVVVASLLVWWLRPLSGPLAVLMGVVGLLATGAVAGILTEDERDILRGLLRRRRRRDCP